MELRASHYHISSNINQNIKHTFQNRTRCVNISQYKKEDTNNSIISEIFISSFIYVSIRGVHILYTLLQW
jgi:hypothetical protein